MIQFRYKIVIVINNCDTFIILVEQKSDRKRGEPVATRPGAAACRRTAGRWRPAR